MLLSEICRVLGIQSYIEKDVEIEHLVFDSRKIIFPENSVFFALEGLKRNGIDYDIYVQKIDSDAYNKGIRCFVVKVDTFTGYLHQATILNVPDSLEALQKIGIYQRNKYKVPIIGITGSNGKTIVKEWIYSILSPERRVVKSPGSFNSQIGVPLSVWNLNDTYEIGIFEAGISRVNEMDKLQKLIDPTIGVFTNLGNAHDEGFKDHSEKLNEKIKLFKNCQKIICSVDDDQVYKTLEYNYGRDKIISYSIENKADANLRVTGSETGKLTIQFDSENLEIEIPFQDEVSRRLVLSSYLVGRIIGLDHNLVNKKIFNLTYPKMRMEVERGVNECNIINDSYNSDIESIQNSLNYLKYLQNGKKKTLILSDFLGMNEDSYKILDTLSYIISDCNIEKIMLIGNEIVRLANILPNDIHKYKYANTDDFIKDIDNHFFINENILIKGSRKFELEKVFRKLSDNLNKTQLIIDLNALDNNISVYRSYLKKTTGIIAVIKASGYGSGAIKLAEHFQKSGIDYLSVAFVNEAIELRKAGIKMPVMVFNPDLDYFDEILKYNIEPVIYSAWQLKQIEDIGIEAMKIHIKLDTGMKRLGFEDKEIDMLCDWLVNHRDIRVMSIYSHLAASDNPEYDKFTLSQFLNFQKNFDFITRSISYKPLKHILNSSGIVRWAEYQFDMVRLGSGMHGIDISNSISEKLEPVNTLKSRINQIKILNPGEGIGYGIRYKKNRYRKIAILPLGYADGVPRLAGNDNYKVWINGKYVPIVADINMDMTFIDVTEIENVEVGDAVEIFGKNAKITELARAGNTIFYEIISKISTRIKRVYTLG